MIDGTYQPYFLTATTVNWLPLFSNPTIAQIILDSLTYLTQTGQLTIFAYVLMENHLHLVAAGEDLPGTIARLKSFTARKSIDLYQQLGNHFILDQLSFHKKDNKVDREFQFWQEGSHPQMIVTTEMMQQKVMYIHQNPVRRGYVDHEEHWRYSSARDFAGQKGLVPIQVEW